MTYTLTPPQQTTAAYSDPEEILLSLIMSLNADLMQLRSERLETLTALGMDPDREHLQLIVEALDAIDFEIDQTNLELNQLALLLEKRSA